MCTFFFGRSLFGQILPLLFEYDMNTLSTLHLITLPVPEKVNRSILSPLDYGPASIVHILFTPRLHQLVTGIWFKKVHSTSGMSSLHGMKAVAKRTSKSRKGEQHINILFNTDYMVQIPYRYSTDGTS